MKNTFFKFWVILAFGLITQAFYSCDKNDETDDNGGALKITATNVMNSSTQIATVKALAYWEAEDDGGKDAIAQTQYKNNGFSLELPVTLPDKYLYLVSEDLDEDWTISISDENAKMYFLEDISGFDENEDQIGDFYLEELDGDLEHYVAWVYVDRNVTIKGEGNYISDNFEEITNADLKLIKGWNVVYSNDTESYNSTTGKYIYTYTISSKKPSGVNYSWYFYSDNSAYSEKSFIKQKALFPKK